jgi:pyridoxine 5-phosphate synthase
MKRRLGVNIDHIATLREARKVWYPDPYEALSVLQACEVDQVTIHLREDRRHIQDHDLERIISANVLSVNLEMAVTAEMVSIASKAKPKMVTFVPEKREEVTTEGGLDCLRNSAELKESLYRLKQQGIHCSLFIDPDNKQIEAAKELGADAIELHTGSYCNVVEDAFQKTKKYDLEAFSLQSNYQQEFTKLQDASKFAASIDLKVYAGHGLHRDNLVPVVSIQEIEEYNIGHAIIARAVFVGLKQAIQEIQTLLAP